MPQIGKSPAFFYGSFNWTVQLAVEERLLRELNYPTDYLHAVVDGQNPSIHWKVLVGF